MDSIERTFVLLSILPTPETTKRAIKFRNISIGISFFAIEIIVLMSSAAFFLEYVENDLKNSLYALLQIAAYCSSTYTFAVGFTQRRDIQKLFPEFQNIIKECKNIFLLFNHKNNNNSMPGYYRSFKFCRNSKSTW